MAGLGERQPMGTNSTEVPEFDAVSGHAQKVREHVGFGVYPPWRYAYRIGPLRVGYLEVVGYTEEDG